MSEKNRYQRLEKMIEVLRKILKHRQTHPTYPSEALYYELLIKYWDRVLRAKDDGKYLVMTSQLFPTELFVAMEHAVVPFSLEAFAESSMVLLGDYAQIYSEADGFGIPVETCSSQRPMVGMIVKDMVPRPDFALWAAMVCDNVAKGGYIPVHFFNIPYFVLDHTYQCNDREIRYFAQELQGAIDFMEAQTGAKLDWDKLKKATELSWQSTKLQEEINLLRKAIPAPSRSRGYLNRMYADMTWAGTPESVQFYELAKDEIRRNLENKQGAIPQERFRLMNLFIPPVFDWKLMDWLEKEYGAVSVIEPYSWWEIEQPIDPTNPLEFIAARSFYRDVCLQMGGPGDQFIRVVKKLAKEYKVDGAIYFAHIGCRHACAMIKAVRDTLTEGLEIPMVTIDIDVADPSFTSEEEIRSKLEEFFELLEEKKPR